MGGKRRNTRRRASSKKRRNTRRKPRSSRKRRHSRSRRGGFLGIPRIRADPCSNTKTKKMGFYDWGTAGKAMQGTYTGNMKQFIRYGKNGYVVDNSIPNTCYANGQGKWTSDDGKISFEGPWENQGNFKGTKPPATQKRVQTDSAGNQDDVWTDESGKTCTSRRGKSLGCV